MTNAPAPKRRVGQDGDSDAEKESAPAPPDGGWGWMVVFASFMIHIVTDGVTYSFGVFYVEFLNYFNEGKGTTAWIASILVGVTLCSGPISSFFVNKYGCRAVTIAGSILGFVCLICSIFAKNVITLYFTIGLGTGLGFGLIYLPAIVSVTCYFEKYRSLATGIAVCGSGFGTFIFAPLIEFLIEEYRWQGALLLISSLVLQCSTFGALFRPVEQYQKRKKKVNLPVLENLLDKSGEDDERDENEGKLNGGTNIHRPVSLGNFSVSQKIDKRKELSLENGGNRLAASQPALAMNGESKHHGSQTGIMQRKDVFYRSSIQNIPQLSNGLSYEKISEKEITSHNLETRRQSKICGCIPFSADSCGTIAEMLDFSLLKDPIFILFTISNFCTSIGFSIPYVYIVAQAQKRGIPKDSASYLLGVIGIANLVGRVILGYLSDKTWINRLFVYNTSLTVCGLATAFSAFCYDFYSFAIYGSVFGFTIGAYVGLTSVILVDLLGLEHLTNAFGLLLLFQGIASFLGPPIAGWLYDASLSYDPGFVVAGVTIGVSGVMLYIIPWLQRYLRRKRNQKETVLALT